MQTLDTQNMLGEIDNLPDQLAHAWALGQNPPLPDAPEITQIVISGMGDSAIGADLLARYAAKYCNVPVMIHSDYSLPACASGEKTLFIASSHSGETEETLDAFREARKRNCTILAICTGGNLAEEASAAGYPVWRFSHQGPSHAAIGFSFGLLLAVFARLGLLPAQDELVAGAVAAMKAQQKTILSSVPAATNPAKRYAGQLVGRWVTIYGSDMLAAVARRWKNQINKLAKAPANFECLPDADHNSLAGIANPSDELLMPHTLTLFLRAASDNPRNTLRVNITRQTFMLEGLNTDFYLAQGDSRLAQMWTAIHFGDYMAYYLAIAYSTDPTPVDALTNLKASLPAQK